MKTFLLLASATLLISCTTTYPNQGTVGKLFPSVQGESLDGRKWRFPEDLKGKKSILLVAYKQNSQFDVDRWLIALDEKKVEIPFFEVPTISGLVPRMFAKSIDEGMRSGIPRVAWSGVVTIYKDGARLKEFLGSERPLNTRVLLLDENGRVLFQHEDGFGVQALNELLSQI